MIEHNMMKQARRDNHKLKIVNIIRRFVESDWGGTESAVDHLAQSAKCYGDESDILSTSALKLDDSIIMDTNIQYFSYFYPVFPLSKSDKLALDRKAGDPFSLSLLFYLLTHTSDIIHSHAMNRLAFYSYLIARLKKIPFVITLHGGYHHVPDDEKASLERIYKKRIHWGRIFDKLFRSQRFIYLADAIICVGYEEYLTAKQQYQHSTVIHIGNGVDLEAFTKPITTINIHHQLGIDPSKKILLNVGRIDAQKGQHLSLECLLQLDEDYHLVLCGPITQDKYYAALLATIEANHLQQRVTIITDAKPKSDLLLALYQQADVFLLSSIHEPFGIVILEAWASKLPVIANPVGGVKYLVDHEETGILVDFTDTEKVVRSIKTICTDIHYVDNISFNAFQKVSQEYTWSAIYEKTRQLYVSLKYPLPKPSGIFTHE